MEYYIARAFIIGSLTKPEIEALQARENVLGRGLMPQEAQMCLRTRNYKDFYQIPEDDEDQSKHSFKVSEAIRAMDLLKTLTPGRVCATSPDILHEYDWNIFNRLEELGLHYEGNRKLAGRLKDLVKVLPFVLGAMKWI